MADAKLRIERFEIIQDFQVIGAKVGVVPLRELTRTTRGLDPPPEMEPFVAVAAVHCIIGPAKLRPRRATIGFHMESPDGSILSLP